MKIFYSSFVFVMLAVNSAHGENFCDLLLSGKRALVSQVHKPYFKQFTNPLEFQKEHFTFFVYSINHYDTKHDLDPHSIVRGLLSPQLFPFHLQSAYDRVGAIGKLSTSIITEKKTATYAVYGFILSPPLDKDVVAAWHTDLGSPPTLEATRARIRVKESFEKLISKTSTHPKFHNELVLDEKSWQSSGGKIIGLFYKRGNDGELLISNQMLLSLQELSRIKNIPLIEIPQNVKDLDDKPLKITKQNHVSLEVFDLDAIIDHTQYFLKLVKGTDGVWNASFGAYKKVGFLLEVSDREHYQYFLDYIKRTASSQKIIQILSSGLAVAN